MIWRPFLSREYVLPQRVYFLDTTLRDGEQTAGVSLRIEDKLEIAESLADLGVGIIEAGFPAVSRGELEAIKQITSLGLRSKTCVLSRCEERDIDLAASTGADWIHIFIATSEIHMRYKLRLSPEQVLEKAVKMTEYAKSYGMIVHFSAEDATRTDFEFLLNVYRAVRDAGADSIDIPDTVGIAIPVVMKMLVRMTREATKIPVAVHCHDDLGLATANTLAGVEGGAEIVHVTVNGIGERAGNASLEEVASALRFLYGVETGINLPLINKVSRLVALKTGIAVPKNKAIVGRNAFSHESGIHVHGIISNPITYEPILPEEVGQSRRIVIGKHSGMHAIRKILKDHGYDLSNAQVKQILDKIKELGDIGEKISEYMIVSIVNDVLKGEVKPAAYVEDFNFWCNKEMNKCTVRMNFLGESIIGEGESTHIIRAVINAGVSALKKITSDVEVVDYEIYFPPDEERHPIEVDIKLMIDGHEFTGRGLGRGIINSTLNAVAGAISQYLMLFKKQGMMSEST